MSIKHGVPFSTLVTLVSTTSPFTLLTSPDGAMTLCGTCGVEERTVACMGTWTGQVGQGTTRRAGTIEPEPARNIEPEPARTIEPEPARTIES